MKSRLHELQAAGQAVWLDYIDRAMLKSGELQRNIELDALSGMTSNPTIFERALAQGTEYDEQIASATASTPWELFEEIASDDVRAACDVFRGVYDRTNAADGYVSIEVSPTVAHDTEGTVTEAKRLWARVDRPNVMIKVPGTPAGADAARELITAGINVNITLLFAVSAHARVIDAYIDGLEARAAAGQDVSRVASVASFFVSRVDTAIDARLDKIVAEGLLTPEAAKALKGRAAIANAKLAYKLAREKFSGERWEKLAAKGARIQRPLWASTSTKNPEYRDVMYVEELIGPDTVNTLPPATINAFRDHGNVRQTVETGLDEIEPFFEELTKVGLSLGAVTEQLLTEGLESFQKSFDSLLAGLETKSKSLGRELVAEATP